MNHKAQGWLNYVRGLRAATGLAPRGNSKLEFARAMQHARRSSLKYFKGIFNRDAARVGQLLRQH